MSVHLSNMNDIISNINKQKEAIILEQLEDLIRKGLLIVECTEPVIVSSECSDRIELRQAVRLVLKDKEYIEKLEAENAKLVANFETLKHLIDESLDKTDD